ncbi:MAG: hypothetical protein ACFFER_13165 [Candidatus Thorarchaeota archaeon]
MRVEVDISDLDFGAYYRDDKSVELEKLLRNDSKYAECMVKREYWDEDINHNPFVILDTDGKVIITLEKWAVDALNGNEIISFIEVQGRRDDRYDTVESVLVLIMLASIMVGAFSLMFLPTIQFDTINSTVSTLILAAITFLISGLAYYARRKNTHSKKMNIDLEAAREDLTFLEALRKLAAVAESEYVYNNEYVKRLEELESLLRGGMY